jgi:hypothetical protein
MLFDCPSVAAFCNRLAKILHTTRQKKLISNGFSTLNTAPQQFANYLLRY